MKYSLRQLLGFIALAALVMAASVLVSQADFWRGVVSSRPEFQSPFEVFCIGRALPSYLAITLAGFGIYRMLS